MSILCCCRNRQLAEKETQTETIELPSQPPRARLSKTLSRSDTDMFLSSILASRGPSQLMTPAYHNIVDPEAVEADDSDEDGPERNTRLSNIGTLGSIRTKLIRRLSHRGNTKPGSRPSIGTSDEELARRAELKRLMHKRIQEELKSEEEEDDLRLAPPERPSINNCREPELSGGGPRDTIEFSVSSIDEQETNKEVNTLPETSIFPTPVVCGAQESFPQRISCSEPLRGSTSNLDHDKESFIRPPSPSHLTPVHLLGGSGRESPSTASWRLSYSAIHIESYIEPLVDVRQVSRPQSPEPGDLSTRREDDTTQPQGADTTDFSNPTMQDETTDTSQTMQFEHPVYPEINHKENDISGRYSPLDVWLRSQDLHCASILSSRSNSEIALDRLREPRIQEVKDLQMPTDSADVSSHQDEMADSSSISQEHARAWPGTSKHTVREEKLSLDTPNDESIALSRVLNQMENTLPLESSIMDQTQEISSRYTSSRYTTRPNSRQATPRDSRPSLTDMLGSRKVMQPLPPTYGPVNPYRVTASDSSDISSYRTALNKTPSLDHPKPKPDGSQLPTAEALSNNASETASFKQREEELKSIQKRFGLTPARLSPMTPVRSKFREEFEDPKSLNNGRSSILSKLHLVLPKRAGASSSRTESNKSREEIGSRSTQLLKPKILNSSGLGPNIGGFLPSNMQQSATGLQQHAAKEEAEPRHWRWKAKIIKVSMPKPTINKIGPHPIFINSHRHGIIATHAIDQERKITDNNSSPAFETSNELQIPDEVEPSGTIDIHAGVLQEWVEQLQAEDMQRQNRTESRANVPRHQPRGLRTPPESWAKWPSHTREKRTAPAGEKDKVSSWDFALVMNSNPSEIGAEGKLLPKSRELTATSRTLSSQVSKAFKSGWNKIHAGSFGRASEPGITIQHTIEPRGFLEYPELELQPTAEGYREVQALDQQIDTMKRRSTSRGRDMRKSSSDGARRPLASRIAEEVHKFQMDDKNTAWAEIDYRAKAPPTAQFLSPAHALLTHGSKSCDPELNINAPESQCTYEDCVQSQMLLHDDDNKGTERITIKRARSTGNIETKLLGDTLPVNEAASSDCVPTHKAGISGLRRHQSLGWLRGRGPSGDRNKSLATK